MQEPRLNLFTVPTPAPHTIACYEWGDAAAKHTVLCVHGLTRNGRDFDFLAHDLAREFRVICLDMPGRGKSQWLADPMGYTYPNYLADIGFILKELSISQVSWVGTSMGGILGMMAATYMPGLVRALVLNDIGAFIPAEAMARIRDIGGMPTRFSSRGEAEAAYRLRCATFGIESEAEWQHLFAHGFDTLPDGSLRYNYDPAIFKAGLPKDAPVTDVDLWQLWDAAGTIPALLIHGGESDILTPATVAEMQKRHPGMALHTVPQAGHAPTLMGYKEIALIHEWISAKQETS